MVMLSRSAIALGAIAALLVSGCTSDADAGDDPTSPETEIVDDGAGEETGEPVELEVPYPAPSDAARALPAPLAPHTNAENDEFAVTSVSRLADDRVIVSGVLSFEARPNEDFPASQYEEPGFRYLASGSEFAGLELTAPGDEVTYLPVRDADERCLCSVIRGGMQEDGGDLAVMIVMSAPEGAETVSLSVAGFGDYPDLPVTELEPASITPWGVRETLTVSEARRGDGQITVRVRMAAPGEGSGWGAGVHQFGQMQNCFMGLAAVAGATGTWTEDGCYGGRLPGAGEAIDIEATFPDPGVDDVVLLPWNGHPLLVPIDGEATPGSGEIVHTYAHRTVTAGTSVTVGEELELSLDTSVLFDFDESTLTPQATQALATAVEVLRAQDGRSLTIDGHTDTQGSASYNKQLSLARAEAVRDALADLLGQGWTFTVNGYGQERTLVDERGTPEEVEAAQARNRRVEITIDD